MSFKRVALLTVNKALSALGFALVAKIDDFDSRLIDSDSLNSLFQQLANPIAAWLSTQKLFTPKAAISSEDIAFFYEEFLKSPFRGGGGGSRFNNLLWLFVISRAYKPSVIIDSGTYKGASAWALTLGSPNVPVFSFDLNMAALKHRQTEVQYIRADWTSMDLGRQDVSRGLCYFDDHVDQARRLLEAADRRIPLAVFDDDLPLTSFPPMAHGGFSLPKIEFVLDDALRHKASIQWLENGKAHEWPVDIPYLDKARATIAGTDRVPNCGMVTGIHQTPFRVVALKV